MRQRNYRAYLRSDVYQDTPDGPERPIWCYLVLPQRQPREAKPPQPDDHMARPLYHGPAGLLPSTVAWLKELERTVNAGHERRGEPLEQWFVNGELV